MIQIMHLFGSKRLFIHPRRQRQGYGSVLMKAVEQFAREHSLISITSVPVRHLGVMDYENKVVLILIIIIIVVIIVVGSSQQLYHHSTLMLLTNPC